MGDPRLLEKETMNTLEATFNKLRLRLSNPLDWEGAKSITGKVEEISPGYYEMTLSTHNLKRIGDRYQGVNRPKVIKGQHFIEELKAKLVTYKRSKDKVRDVCVLDRWPVEPNGKFRPYGHQTKIIGVADANPLSPIFSDCGTGKTGAEARFFELALTQGLITRGKILVTAPLSILHTSWEDDIKQFTDLRSAILWTPMSNRVKLGEEKADLGSFDPKPPGTVTTKAKTGVRYRSKVTGEVKDDITVLDGDPLNWTKYQTKWKHAVLIDGTEVPFGPIIGRTSITEDTRANFIKDQLARTDVDLFLINHDGVRIYEDILKEHNFEWVVVDESTKIKSATSQVFRSHVSISWNAKRRNILTGTPNPNGFEDLWSQFYFLDRGMTLEPSKRDYLFEYFRAEIIGRRNTPGGFQNIVRYVLKDEATRDRLIERVRSVGICLEQRDCIDLPPRTDLRRIVYMTAEQEAAYDSMATELVATLRCSMKEKSVRADAVNTLAQIMKLRQITGGFLANREGELVHLSANPKFSDLDDFLEELGGKKVVVVCQFKEEIKQTILRYKALGARAIYGDIPMEERTQTIRDFQNGNDCNLIVLQPQAAGHGITLTAAAHLVFLSLDYNFEYYYQVAKRIERLGQKQAMFVIHTLARYADGTPTIDEDLLSVLGFKSNDRSALFGGGTQSVEDIAEVLTQNLINRNG